MTKFELIKFTVDIMSAVVLAVLLIVFVFRQRKLATIFFNSGIIMFILYFLIEAADIVRFPIFLIDIYIELIPIFYISALMFLCLYMTTYVRDEIDGKDYTTSLKDSSRINIALKVTDYIFNISLYVILVHVFCIVGLNLMIRNFMIPTAAFSISASVMTVIILVVLSTFMTHKSNCLIFVLLVSMFIMLFAVSIIVDDILVWLFIVQESLSTLVEHSLKTLYVALKILCSSLLIFVSIKKWRKANV